MKRLILAFLLLTARVFATVSASTAWETRSGGNDANGGGFVTGASGTDFSQQAAAQFTFTTATTAGANAIFLDAQAATTMVGNILHITGGTNFIVGWYQVTAVSAGVSMTLDRNCTTGAGAIGTGNLGGAFLTIGGAITGMTTSGSATGVGGNVLFIKQSTFTVSATLTFPFSTSIGINVVGYDTTRTLVNTDATRPVITTATNAVTLFTMSSANAVIFRNLEFTTTAGTKAIAITNTTALSGATGPIEFANCKWSTAFPGVLNEGGSSASMYAVFRGCEFTGIASPGVFEFGTNSGAFVECYYCNFHANSAPPILLDNGAANNLIIDHSFIVDNTARGIYMNVTSSGGWQRLSVTNCTIANNTTANVEFLTTTAQMGTINLSNNIIYGANPTLKLATAGTDKALVAVNNAFGGGGSTTNYTTGQGDITLSATPFTNAGSFDYSLNNTAGGGASCRGAGWPQTFAGGTTTSRPDLGAAQHTESAAATQTSYSF